MTTARRRAPAALPAPHAQSSAAARQRRRRCGRWTRMSWLERELLSQLGRGDALAVARRAALEQPCVGELADNHRIEASIANEPGDHAHRIVVVARDRHRELRIGTVGLLGEVSGAHGVEGAHEPRAGEIFLRGDADAVLLDFVSDGTAARRYGIAGVD